MASLPLKDLQPGVVIPSSKDKLKFEIKLTHCLPHIPQCENKIRIETNSSTIDIG